MFWKILTNYKKVAALIKLVKVAYTDKKLTKEELDEITNEILDLLVALGVIEEK